MPLLGLANMFEVDDMSADRDDGDADAGDSNARSTTNRIITWIGSNSLV